MTEEEKQELLEQRVEAWHFDDAAPGMDLFEFLGMTIEEYFHWYETKEIPEGWRP